MNISNAQMALISLLCLELGLKTDKGYISIDIKASSLTQKGLTLEKLIFFLANFESILNVLVRLALLIIYFMKESSRFYLYHFS